MAPTSGNYGEQGFVSGRELFRPLWTYRGYILLFSTTATLCALILTFIYSEKFEIRKTLVFKPDEVTRLQGTVTQAFGAPVPVAPYKIVGTTLEQLAQSEIVLRTVVRRLNLDAEEPRNYTGPVLVRTYRQVKDWLMDVAGDAWSIAKHGRVIRDATASAIAGLRRDVRIRSDDSQVFTLRVRDRHPQRAAAIASEITRELTRLLKELKQKPARTRLDELEGLIATRRQELEELRRRQTALLDTHNVVAISENISAGVTRLSQLALAEAQVAADIRKFQATIAANEGALGPRYYAMAAPAGAGPAAAPRPEGGRGVDTAAEDTCVRLSQNRTQRSDCTILSGLIAKQAALRATVIELEARLAALPKVREEYQRLDHEIRRIERALDVLNDSRQEASLLETKGLSELVIQDDPQPPSAPVTPIKIYHVAVALVLSLLLASGLAFVADFFAGAVPIGGAAGATRPLKEVAAEPERTGGSPA
ncbi:MAG: hypothetical protein R3D27_09520 [Hyphomicrobiaceae bacterium]